MRDVIMDLLRQTNTALPGRVEKYDEALKKADVLPVIDETFADGTVLTLPVLTSVPVIMPATAAARITLPIVPGDFVLLVFAQRSLDLWLSEGGKTKAGDTRMHAMSDAMAIPGIFPFNGVPSSGVNLELTATEIQAGAGGTLHKLLNELAATQKYDNHKHVYNPNGSSVPAFTGPPETGVAAAPTADPMTNAEKTSVLKAE
jgi:hypothetical protein